MQRNSSALGRLRTTIALAYGFLQLLISVSLGQEHVIDGVISAVKAPEFVVIAESNRRETTYKLAPQVNIRVNGNAGDLSQLAAGMSVKLIYDEKLDRVTAVAIAESNEKEVIELSELPTTWSYGSPWVTQDGLTIYWSARAAARAPREIFFATRKTIDEVFSQPQKLFSGTDFSLSSDELEIVLTIGEKLHSAVRRSKTSSFFAPAAAISI